MLNAAAAEVSHHKGPQTSNQLRTMCTHESSSPVPISNVECRAVDKDLNNLCFMRAHCILLLLVRVCLQDEGYAWESEEVEDGAWWV